MRWNWRRWPWTTDPPIVIDLSHVQMPQWMVSDEECRAMARRIAAGIADDIKREGRPGSRNDNDQGVE